MGNEASSKGFCTVLDCTELNGKRDRYNSPSGSETTITETLVISGMGILLFAPASRWNLKWMPERWAEIACHSTRSWAHSRIILWPRTTRMILSQEIPREGISARMAPSLFMSSAGCCKRQAFLGADTVAMHLAAAMQARLLRCSVRHQVGGDRGNVITGSCWATANASGRGNLSVIRQNIHVCKDTVNDIKKVLHAART